MNAGRFTSMVIVFGSLVVVVGCASNTAATDSTAPAPVQVPRRYVNEGAPRTLAGTSGDWFADRTPEDKRMELDSALAKVKGAYNPLLRGEEGGRFALAESASLDIAGLKNGRELTALNVRYPDRVVLHITPTDSPIDVQEMVDATFAPNDRGETHFNYETSVRGLPAVARDAGKQAWDAGPLTIVSYPASIVWTERTSEGQLVEYRLSGDLPVKTLRAMAQSMRRAW